MTVYALTLTWNNSEHLLKLYTSLKESKKYIQEDLAWFIRDNASTDNTQELISSWNEDWITVFKYDNNNDNYATGTNFLIEKAKEDWCDKDLLLLLHDDIIFHDHYSIKHMLNIINSDKNVGIVGTKTFYSNKSKLIQHGGIVFSQKFGNLPTNYRRDDTDDKSSKMDRTFQAVSSCCMLVRTDCFDKLQLGKLDERFNWNFEDVDLCLDIGLLQKKKIVYCGKTNIAHFEGATLRNNPINKTSRGQDVKLFLKKWGGKYMLDHYIYLDEPTYNIYNGK